MGIAVRTRRVADVMTRDPITVSSSAPLSAAWERMREAHVSGLPVVDGAGRVVGVISQTDLLATRRVGDDGNKAPTITVGEAMAWPAVTIGEWAPIDAAARLLLDYCVHRVIVVDEEQRPTGILSTTDFVRLNAG